MGARWLARYPLARVHPHSQRQKSLCLWNIAGTATPVWEKWKNDGTARNGENPNCLGCLVWSHALTLRTQFTVLILFLFYLFRQLFGARLLRKLMDWNTQRNDRAPPRILVQLNQIQMLVRVFNGYSVFFFKYLVCVESRWPQFFFSVCSSVVVDLLFFFH